MPAAGPDSQESLTVARALEEQFQPDKTNYQILGNSVPHLHTHVIEAVQAPSLRAVSTLAAVAGAHEQPAEVFRPRLCPVGALRQVDGGGDAVSSDNIAATHLKPIPQ